MQKVVITGGPGTGKSSLIKTLEGLGYSCFPEIIRQYTEALKKQTSPEKQLQNPLVFSEDPLEFNRLLLEGRSAQYEEAEGADIFFFDRGVIDVLAYMNHFKQDYPEHFHQAGMVLRYDRVFILPPWKDIYKQDEERLESFEEANRIHESLMACYSEYQYIPQVVPPGKLEERARFVLNELQRLA